MKRDHLFFAVSGVAALAFAATYTPGMISFRAFGLNEFMQSFTVLFFVALLFERSLEVFVGGWRIQSAEHLRQRVAAIQERDAKITPEACEKMAKAEYSARTKTLAITLGMGFGLFVAAVGVRALEPFVDAEMLAGLTTIQATTFRLLDIVLTAGLIAGGAEGIHKITKVFSDFMDSTSERTKSKPAAA